MRKKIIASQRQFVFFHTWTVSRNLLRQAIEEEKSMDLDVCVDEVGQPHLGHSKEYHEKSGEPFFNSMPLWEAVSWISRSNIVVMVDCKHHEVWPVIEEVITKIGSERCLVASFVAEFKFGHSRAEGEPDFLTEWSPVEKLSLLKNKFPLVTTTACVKWVPRDLLTWPQYEKLAEYIRQVLKENQVDTVCLGVPGETVTDQWLRYSGAENIIPQIGIDKIELTKLAEVYVGETDHLGRASESRFL